MRKLFYVMGKSSSGKDTIFKLISQELNLNSYILYTTRPIRNQEKNGVDYFFVNDSTFDHLIAEGKVMEYRTYQVKYNGEDAIWRYGTVLDHQFKAKGNFATIGTLESYIALQKTMSQEFHIIPIYIELDFNTRFTRAVERENKQPNPNYQEVCRRLMADETDFSEKNLAILKNDPRFVNHDLKICTQEIINYINSFHE